MNKRADSRQMLKKETPKGPSEHHRLESSCLPRHSRQMDDLDLILCHEDFPRVLVLVCELKQLRLQPSKKQKDREYYYDEPLKSCHGGSSSAVLNAVDRMQKQLLTQDLREPQKKDGKRVLRGQDPITDSLLDDAITLLQEELSLLQTEKMKNGQQQQHKKELHSKKPMVHSNNNGPAQQQHRNKSSPSSEPPIIIKYSKKQTDILMQWMIDHRDNPFPGADDIQNLIQKTGLSQKQIVNWTTNVRKRNRKATCDGAKKPHHFLDFLFLAQHREQIKATVGQTTTTGSSSSSTTTTTALLPKAMIPKITPKNKKKKSTLSDQKETKSCKKRKAPNRNTLTPATKRAPPIKSTTPTFSPYPRTPPVVVGYHAPPPASPYHAYSSSSTTPPPPPTIFEQQKLSPVHSYPISCPPRPPPSYPTPPHFARHHHPASMLPPHHHRASYLVGHSRPQEPPPPRPDCCKSQGYETRQSMTAPVVTSQEIGGRRERCINRHISNGGGGGVSANYVTSRKKNPQLYNQNLHPGKSEIITKPSWEVMEKAQRLKGRSQTFLREDKSDSVYLQPIPLDGPNDVNILEAFATFWENDAGEIVPLELPDLGKKGMCDDDFGLRPSVTDEEENPNCNSLSHCNSSSDGELDFVNECYPLVHSFDDDPCLQNGKLK